MSSAPAKMKHANSRPMYSKPEGIIQYPNLLLLLLPITANDERRTSNEKSGSCNKLLICYCILHDVDECPHARKSDFVVLFFFILPSASTSHPFSHCMEPAVFLLPSCLIPDDPDMTVHERNESYSSLSLGMPQISWV